MTGRGVSMTGLSTKYYFCIIELLVSIFEPTALVFELSV